MSMTRLLLAALLVAAPVQAAEPSTPDLTLASTTVGQPEAVGLPVEAARVAGFRTARWGMDESAVRTAVAADFGQGVANALAPEPVEAGFTAFGAPAVIDEIGGAGRLLYVFADGRLVAVNLVRVTSAAATPGDRQALVDTATRFVASQLAEAWRPFGLVRGRPIAADQIIVLAAADDVGDGLEVRLVGVPFVATLAAGSTWTPPAPRGAAALRIAFKQDIDALAILQPGDFAQGATISGFRTARFGMSEAEVRTAIARDFPSSALAIEIREATATTPRALAIPLIRLNPGPTPAAVAYAFRDGKLAQVDVTWVAPGEATPAQREGLAVAGERLRGYFESQTKKPATVTQAGVLGPNTLLLHAASDAAGASVEATLDGVGFSRTVDGKSVPSPTPVGSAVLRISYRASRTGG